MKCLKHQLPHNLNKIYKHIVNFVLKKILDEIRKLKRTQDVNMDILKELISTYIVSSKGQYEWLSNEFNRKNVHKVENKRALKKRKYYEHTLEYKLKHPIVVALRKIGVYERTRELLGMD